MLQNTTTMEYEVFISYSREDASRIAPIVKLVRAMKKNLVFHDIQNIEHGKRWEPQLLDALDQAQIVIVFWCEHAEKSDYVQKEFEIAIKDDKDVDSVYQINFQVFPVSKEDENDSN